MTEITRPRRIAIDLICEKVTVLDAELRELEDHEYVLGAGWKSKEAEKRADAIAVLMDGLTMLCSSTDAEIQYFNQTLRYLRLEFEA